MSDRTQMILVDNEALAHLWRALHGEIKLCARPMDCSICDRLRRTVDAATDAAGGKDT